MPVHAAAHLVVQHIHEVSIERVHVIDLGEVVQNLGQLVVPVLLRELDLAHVELADALDGPACRRSWAAERRAQHSRQAALATAGKRPVSGGPPPALCTRC